MTMVTLELPQRIYRKAVEAAKATKRPVEQVVIEWIRLPVDESDALQKSALANLEMLTTAELSEIARSQIPATETARLGELLRIQQQRELSPNESHEAAQLVEQEDLLTLRKAKALYLLKQRNAFPSIPIPDSE